MKTKVEIKKKAFDLSTEHMDGHSWLKLEDCLNLLDALLQAEWISVEDAEPEVGRKILFYDGKKIRLGSRESVYNKYISQKNYPFTATHWMPLPEPPNDK